jgi:holdfast attachment protein HfaA
MSRFVPLVFAAAIFASPALADETGASSFMFEQNYGFEYGAENRPFDPRTRDANGNRLVLNGRIMNGGSTLSGGLGDSDGTFEQWMGFSSAAGNQLNVVTNGSFNTVIIDNDQINTGDVTAVVQGE